MGENMKREVKALIFFGTVSFSLCILGGTILAENETSSAGGANIPASSREEAAQAIQQTQPTIDYPSAMLERASSGLTNIAYGPVEVIYQLKEEIKRTDPLRGLIPGLGRGVGWLVVREAVGVFELVTFYLPYKPVLKKFDTDWIYL